MNDTLIHLFCDCDACSAASDRRAAQRFTETAVRKQCGKTWEARDLTDRLHTCSRPEDHEGSCACCCGAACHSPIQEEDAEEIAREQGRRAIAAGARATAARNIHLD